MVLMFAFSYSVYHLLRAEGSELRGEGREDPE